MWFSARTHTGSQTCRTPVLGGLMPLSRLCWQQACIGCICVNEGKNANACTIKTNNFLKTNLGFLKWNTEKGVGERNLVFMAHLLYVQTLCVYGILIVCSNLVCLWHTYCVFRNFSKEQPSSRLVSLGI